MAQNHTLDALKRFWWIIVAFVVGGAIAGALPSPPTADQAPVDVVTKWTASHTLLVSGYDVAPGFNQLDLFTTVGQVPARVAAEIDFNGPPAALAAQITVVADYSSGALRITTTQSSADRAVEIADTFADELVSYLAERQDVLRQDRLAANLERLSDLEQEVIEVEAAVRQNDEDTIALAKRDALSRQYSAAYEQYDQIQTDQGAQLVLTTLERAQPIASTQSGGGAGLGAPRSRVTRGALGALVGGLLGFGLAILLVRTDRRLRTREQAEEILGMTTHVVIPVIDNHHPGDLAVLPNRHEPLSDSYRTLRSVISFMDAGTSHRDGSGMITLIVSPGPGDGKTSVSANLASAFVEAGKRTVAVNADFRRPTLSQRLSVVHPEPIGLTLGQIEHAPLELLLTPVNDIDLSVLDLAGLRPHNPGEMARITARVLPDIVAVTDHVVIDSSPVGATAEVLEFMPLADTIVIVIKLGHTPIQSARRMIGIIRALSSANLLLVVVGGDDDDSSYQYYSITTPGETTNWFDRYRRKPQNETGKVPVATSNAPSTSSPP
jgi:Mrp family chromosome partitioning ATPase